VQDGPDVKYKEGDRGRFWLHAETTDKLLIFATNGRFYTLPCDKLPGGRGAGEPIRLMIDLANDEDIVEMHVHRPGQKLLVAASDGRGFIVPEKEVAAQTRAGKQALNLAEGVVGRVCTPAVGDHIASLGENRKLLIFPIGELPEMNRGRGITLQKFKQGGLADVKVFALEQGLEVKTGSKSRVYAKAELKDWIGQRAQAGRLPPQGFPRSGKI
jgi:topoisomerase-4 subunit A